MLSSGTPKGMPACLTPRLASGGALNMTPEPHALPFSGQPKELPFHRIYLAEIRCDVVVTTALPGREAEAAARVPTPSSQWTCTTYSLPVSRQTRVKRHCIEESR
jgi:hypothetical protein